MKILNISLIVSALFFTACDKSLDVKPVEFDVTSASNTGQQKSIFTTMDTIMYQFTGKPDIITFYSGAPGQRYEFKDRTMAEGTPQLQFTSLRANGSQTNSLQLLISTDFKGAVAKTKNLLGVIVRDTAATNANIAAATWTNITDRAKISTGTATPSGVIDLSDFAKQGKPVFVAFKYKAVAGTAQNKYTITNFLMNNVLTDGSVYTQANFAASNQSISNYGVNSPGLGWLTNIDLALNANNYRWIYAPGAGTGGSLTITGGTTVANSTADAEAWAILGPVDLRKVTPDAGVGIKVVTAVLSNFSSIGAYTVPGSYTATFVGSNNSVNGSTTALRQLPITIKTP